MIKVLHYGLSNNKGGIENVVLSWLKHIPDDISFDFIFEDFYEFNYKKELYGLGKNVNIYHVSNRYRNPIKHYKEIERIIRENNYDFVHCHVMTMNEPTVALITNKMKDCMTIYHCHSMYDKSKFSFKENILQLFTKIMLYNKKYLRLACSETAGLSMFKTNDFYVIENGIDVDKFKFSIESRKKIRNKHHISDDAFVIGHVGRSSIDKNYPFILSSFSEYLKLNQNSLLLLIGNVSEDKDIINLVKEYEISNNVVFVGISDNVYDYYSSMDAFYLPSLNEGFAIVLLEAQASGLRCVASKNVPIEVKATDNIEFVELDVRLICNFFDEIYKNHQSREMISIDAKFLESNSAKKIFNYYYNNFYSKN